MATPNLGDVSKVIRLHQSRIRHDDRNTAHELLAEAEEAATRLGEDSSYDDTHPVPLQNSLKAL
jgi:hypothetical protein